MLEINPGLRARPSRSHQNMYAIGPLPCGYQIVFAGEVTALELLAWLDDVRRHIVSPPKDFGLLLDLRSLAPMSPGATRVLAKGLQFCQEKGLGRTAVVVLGRATKLEFTRLAKESGLYQWERYLSAEETPDWYGRGLAWIGQGIDPEPG